jgi:hypothetical protein
VTTVCQEGFVQANYFEKMLCLRDENNRIPLLASICRELTSMESYCWRIAPGSDRLPKMYWSFDTILNPGAKKRPR